MYDIFYLGHACSYFEELKVNYPSIKIVTTFEEAKKKSLTKFFWVIPSDVVILDSFNFDYIPDEWSQEYIHVFKNSNNWNGVALFPRKSNPTAKELKIRMFSNQKQVDIVASNHKPYDIFEIDSYDEYLEAFNKSTTEMFWAISTHCKIIDNKILSISYESKNVHDREFKRSTHHTYLHKIGENTYNNFVWLLTKQKGVSKREFEYKFLVNAKHHDIIVSESKQYDVFEIDSYDEYLYALENSTTELFWMSSANITATIPDVYFDYSNTYDRKQNHAFIHQVDDKDCYNGVFLCSTHQPLTEREITHRHPINRKEWDVIGSTSKKYDVFEIDSYDEYLSALKNSTTEMFWMSSRNITATIPNIYFSHDNEYDRKQNHVFIHQVGDQKSYNGVFLCSKHIPLSKKEVEFRHPINRKEWDIVGSTSKKYDVFEIDSYDEYLYALETSTTEMFWMSSANITATIPDVYFDYSNTYDRKQNHAFVHQVGDQKSYNGLFLCSKHIPLSKNEIEFRHPINRKEWDIVGSTSKKYDAFEIDTYDEYLAALENSTTEMFWSISRHALVTNTDIFLTSYYPINLYDNKTKYERANNHTYLHKIGNDTYKNYVCLFAKSKKISKKEFITKEIKDIITYDTIVSEPRPYEKVFISYQEPTADENYAKILEKFPDCKRVHGIKGIHQAHIAAAKLCFTPMFWIIDGDAQLVDNFNFEYLVQSNFFDHVHVWRSINPINDLVYGYGGVKLFPTQLTIDMDTSKPDMTTSISNKFKAVDCISNITAFNTDPFNSWRSAFRECAKLSSKVIDRQKDDETNKRLDKWCTVGEDRLYGSYAIKGAIAGTIYGTQNQGNLEALKKINDFDWLREQFNKCKI